MSRQIIFTEKELALSVSEKTGFEYEDVKLVIEETFKSLKAGWVRGYGYKISGFGFFGFFGSYNRELAKRVRSDFEKKILIPDMMIKKENDVFRLCRPKLYISQGIALEWLSNMIKGVTVKYSRRPTV